MDELAELIRQESFLHTGLEGNYPLHPRARLRCHPVVANKLMQQFIMDNLLSYREDDPSTILGIPVTIDATMEPGTWQFILGEGKI